MKKFGRKFFVLLAFPGLLIAAGEPEFSRTQSIIDFRLSYPILSLNSGTKIRQKNYLGMDLAYQFYFWERVGPVLNLGGWTVPVRVGTKKTIIGCVSAMGGGAYRFFPHTYLDPVIMGLGGVGWQAAGNHSGSGYFTQLGTRFSFNLLSQSNPFQDTDLALGLSGSFYRIFRPLQNMSANYFDFGLSLRGRF